MLRQARVNLSNAKLHNSFADLDAQALPFGDRSFDAVSNHLLYHVEDRERAISEVRRVLRPRGAFYAAPNGLAHLRELDRIIKRIRLARSTLEENVERFGLESGESRLRGHFGSVELRRYEDSLLVTEARSSATPHHQCVP